MNIKRSLLTSMVLAAGCLLKAQTGYQVTFVNKQEANGFKPEKVYLFSIEDRAVLDSAACENGTYVLKGTATLPKLASICGTATGYNVVAAFVLDETPLQVVLDRGVKVEGSDVNARMAAITDAINQGGVDQRRIQQEATTLAEKYGGQLPDSIGKRLDKEWEDVSARQMHALRQGILDNKDNLIPAYFIFNYDDVLGMDFLDTYLRDYPYKHNALLKSTFHKLEGAKRKAAGAAFTDFALADMQGVSRKLSDYAGKGHYVLVDFWASWCGPCRQEMPLVKSLYEKYHPKGFEIVGVSFDTNKEDWIKAVEQMGMTWPQLSDLKAWKSEAAQLYDVRAIPATLLIGPDGKIVASGLRGAQLQKKLEEIYE